MLEIRHTLAAIAANMREISTRATERGYFTLEETKELSRLSERRGRLVCAWLEGEE